MTNSENKDGLVIISGPAAPSNKNKSDQNLKRSQTHQRLIQVDPSGNKPGGSTYSVEDPPEYGVHWPPQTTMECKVTSNIFIGGITVEEHERREALPRRKLVAADIPNEPWREHYGEYDLREDGAIVSGKMFVELGWVRKESGTVSWTQM